MFDEILTRLRHNPLFDEYYNIQYTGWDLSGAQPGWDS